MALQLAFLIEYINAVRPASRRQRKALLEEVCGRLGLKDEARWRELTARAVADMRDEMARQFKPTTVNNALSAFRGALKAAAQAGYISLDTYFELISVPGLSLPMPPATPATAAQHSEVRPIVQACWATRTAIGDRDAFVCAALLLDGLTAPEIVNLRPGDINLSTGRLSTRENFYIQDLTKEALDRWMRTRDKSAAFIVQRFRGTGATEIMSIQTVYDILRRSSTRADLRSKTSLATPPADKSTLLNRNRKEQTDAEEIL